MESLGIYSKWKNRDSILKEYGKSLKEKLPSWDLDLLKLRAYSEGDNKFERISDDMKTLVSATPPFAGDLVTSFSCAERYFSEAAILCCSGDESIEWITPFAKGTAYRYWGLLIQIESNHGSPSFNFVVLTISRLLFLGWTEQAEVLCKHAQVLYENKRFSDVIDEFSQPLNHWILRICFDYFGLSFDGWGKGRRGECKNVFDPGQSLGEPILNLLFDHWKDKNLENLSDQLIWLCDYYTYRTSNVVGLEFSNDSFNAYFPTLIFGWFRLRTNLNLLNPDINHPLLKNCHISLPDAVPIYTDTLLTNIVTRIEKEELPLINKPFFPEKKIGTTLNKSWFSSIWRR